ncbi:MAG: hypothetical protein EHM58_17440 [Ignavibacteriae bacterium]|nr:MAG: hypothetical protein EHM58_17440 [Ignavibacteriota bacterium]
MFECIQLTFKFTGSYPFIGFITKFSSDTERRMLSNSVSDEDIKSIINNISMIIIGAYDEEGYLIVEIK